jgi:hypothetical protein
MIESQDEEKATLEEALEDEDVTTEFREEERSRMREELSEYLNEVRTRTDDEGKSIVQYPENFDNVANVMNRSDLHASGEQSWSQCMLDDGFNRSFEGGRYQDPAETKREQKIEKGLKEISLLDEKLHVLHKKSYALRSFSLTQDQDDDDDGAGDGSDADNDEISVLNTERSELSVPDTARSDGLSLSMIEGLDTARSTESIKSARSQASTASTVMSARSAKSEFSRLKDTTFITRAKKEAHCASPASTPPQSARSQQASRVSPSSPSSFSSPDSRGSMDMADTESPFEKVRKRPRNFLQENKESTGAQSSLTIDEQLRLQTLLLDEEAGEEMMTHLSQYGFTTTQKERVEEIDTKLEEMQQYDPLGISNVLAGNMQYLEGKSTDRRAQEKAAYKDKNAKTDYLRQQKEQRIRSTYMKTLDKAIENMSKGPVNLSGLVDQDEYSEFGAVVRVDHSVDMDSVQSLVPDVARIDPNRNVSLAEVHRLTRTLVHLFREDGETLAHGSKIDRVVFANKREIAMLEKLRRGEEIASEPPSSSSSSRRGGSSFKNSFYEEALSEFASMDENSLANEDITSIRRSRGTVSQPSSSAALVKMSENKTAKILTPRTKNSFPGSSIPSLPEIKGLVKTGVVRTTVADRVAERKALEQKQILSEIEKKLESVLLAETSDQTEDPPQSWVC